MTPKETEEIKELIEKSGNSFHSKVVKVLRDEKWNTLVSPYYSDNFTDKPRELDIIAEKKFDALNYGTWMGTLNARLFIECKYINGKTVFWFDTKDKNRAIERIMTDTSLEHPNRNTGIQQHHYFIDTPVAKLFSSEKSRGEDNELINKAINQNLNALIYYRDRKDIIPEDPNRRSKVLRYVSYPIILVNSFDNFFRINMGDETGKIERITEPFQLEVNYAYVDKGNNDHNEYFLIDVVSIEKLPDFLASLEKTDIKIVSEKVSWEEQERVYQQQVRNRDRGLGNNSAI